MKINVDFRLLDVSLELHALEDHYDLIEKQIKNLNSIEEGILEDYLKKEKLTPDDPEWHFAQQEYDHKIEFLLPRFFWYPFIVSLYAVFETSVMEIAFLLQKNKKQGLSINDLKGNFLERAIKYYKNVLNFELCGDNKDWQRIKILTDIRHAVAHANGRIDMLTDKSKRKLNSFEKQQIGISTFHNYLIVESSFSKEAFSSVSSVLKDLVARYKVLDSKGTVYRDRK